jgi:RNase adaptor protein for sRNA GlmZ degradation
MITVHSYGILHNRMRADGLLPELPKFTLTLDLSERLHDPHVDPTLRELNGFDERVVNKVLGTTGAWHLINSIAGISARLRLTNEPTLIGIASAGGRHRSVVIADQVFNVLSNLGENVDVKHIDVFQPVVERPEEVPA